MKRIPPIEHVVAVCVVTVMLSGLVAKPQELQTKSVDDPEAYSVYASLLPAESVRIAHAKTLVFHQASRSKPIGSLSSTPFARRTPAPGCCERDSRSVFPILR